MEHENSCHVTGKTTIENTNQILVIQISILIYISSCQAYIYIIVDVCSKYYRVQMYKYVRIERMCLLTGKYEK